MATATRASTPPVVGALTERASASTTGSLPVHSPTIAAAWSRRVGVDDDDVDVVAADLPLERAGVAAGDDPAAVDDDDVVGEALGLVEVLRRQQQRGAAVDERVEHVPQLGARPRVETGGRLVEEQHLGRATSVAARSRRRRMPPE